MWWPPPRGRRTMRSSNRRLPPPVNPARPSHSDRWSGGAGLGVVGVVAVAYVDYRVLGALAIPLYLGALGLLGFVLLAGKTIYGAQRWLVVGPLSIQPSELAKFAVIVCLARYLAGK